MTLAGTRCPQGCSLSFPLHQTEINVMGLRSGQGHHSPSTILGKTEATWEINLLPIKLSKMERNWKYLALPLPSSHILLNSSTSSFQGVQEDGEWGLSHTRIAFGVFWQKPPLQPFNTKTLPCKPKPAALRSISEDNWVRTMFLSSYCEESYTRDFQNLQYIWGSMPCVSYTPAQQLQSCKALLAMIPDADSSQQLRDIGIHASCPTL